MEEVAQNFSEALIAAHRMLSRGDSVSQGADPELTRRFCNAVISYLDVRAAHVFAASQEQLEQTPEGGEPAEPPAMPAQMPEAESVESVGAYIDLLNSMVTFYMGSDAITVSYPWSEEAVERGLRTSRR